MLKPSRNGLTGDDVEGKLEYRREIGTLFIWKWRELVLGRAVLSTRLTAPNQHLKMDVSDGRVKVTPPA
jgi:hypothetical protein